MRGTVLGPRNQNSRIPTCPAQSCSLHATTAPEGEGAFAHKAMAKPWEKPLWFPSNSEKGASSLLWGIWADSCCRKQVSRTFSSEMSIPRDSRTWRASGRRHSICRGWVLGPYIPSGLHHPFQAWRNLSDLQEERENAQPLLIERLCVLKTNRTTWLFSIPASPLLELHTFCQFMTVSTVII